MTEPTIVHLVPHTHWDREWYEPFQVFRMRLVDLIDELLDRMVQDDRLRFTLDGQAATVDDYLEVRPDAEPVIRRLIAEGRLAIGPWQILLDEFLVSGETIVRNLEFGWARAAALGAAMPVGYLPDMFGHIAQMPQILRLAGIERAVVWRGVPLAVTRHAFGWSAPDGSRVETEYLVGGYGNCAHLFDVADRFAEKLGEFRRLYADYYGDRSVLAMYGTDHAVPSPRLADLVERVNSAGGEIRVRMETLTDYLAGRAYPDDTIEWTGELRSGARANMLMNVVSARVDLKAAAARVERLLERYAEPLAALHGGPWPARLFELAWRRVVDDSAHDSICGCSHDSVVAQVIGRYAEAEQIAQGIVRRTLDRIADGTRRDAFAVINPSPVDRTDLIELEVVVPPGWSTIVVRVGDRVLPIQQVGRADLVLSEHRLPARDIPGFFERRRHGRELFGRWINSLRVAPACPDGRPRLTVQVDAVADPPELDVEELLASIEAVTGKDPAEVWDLVVEAPDRRTILARIPAPALGWADAREADGPDIVVEPVPNPVRVAERSLDNGLIAVEVAGDGTLRLRGQGSVLDGVGRIVDGGDYGDSYNYGPPDKDTLVDAPTSVEVAIAERGPLRGALQVVRRYPWPTGILSDGSARSTATVETTVVTRLELRADEPFLRVRLDFENRSRDHRVRWHIPLGHTVDGSSAEGQFAVVDRGLTVEGGHGEVPLPTFPAHGFIHARGVSVLLDQVTEYEVVEGRELALTVLRSFGLISRNDNPYREDPAGPQIPVPDAQLLGERTYRFALYPHAGDWSADGTLTLAERYRHPFVSVRGTAPIDRHPGNGPDDRAERAGLRIEGSGVGLSALRRRDDWLELRVVNEGREPTQAVIHAGVAETSDVDLVGRIGPSLLVDEGVVRLDLRAGEIRTIRMRLEVRGCGSLHLRR